MTQQRVLTIAISLFSVLAVTTFLLEWQFSPLNKAIAWYHLKTNSYATTVQGAKYVHTLLENKPFASEISSKLLGLPYSEVVLSSTISASTFVTTTVEDVNFPKNASYTYPQGKEGRYNLEERTLYVNGRQTVTYQIMGKTIEEPLSQITYQGTKDPEVLKSEILASWKTLSSALLKKEVANAEVLLTFAEQQKFTKTSQLSDLSYRLGAPITMNPALDNETDVSIMVGTLTLRQKNCAVSADIAIVYDKAEKKYRFDQVYSALASLCAKPKPSNGILSCANCWLAPVSKQFSLLSTYAPYVVSTGLNGGGFVTPDTKIALTKLFADAKANGISTIRVSSSYRSYSTQNDLFNTYVNNEKKNGLSETQAIAKANTYSAKPGHSEHQLGTTLDLMACKSPCNFYDSINTPLYAYLKKNAHKFGFVISYPDGSQSYTGYVYEPWHVRYVGVTYAKELYNRGYLTKKGFYLYQFLLEKGKY